MSRGSDAQAVDQDFFCLERLLWREQVQGSGDFVGIGSAASASDGGAWSAEEDGQRREEAETTTGRDSANTMEKLLSMRAAWSSLGVGTTAGAACLPSAWLTDRSCGASDRAQRGK